MNYLAHVLLSGEHPDWQLGGYLGDFLKGPLHREYPDRLGEPWSAQTLAGVQLHRNLDAYVETLPEYRALVELLGPSFRRVGGIVIDVMLDHLLVQNWDQFHPRDLESFSRDFYEVCHRHFDRLPPRAARFIEAAARHDLFLGYGDVAVYLSVIERIASRLRYATNLVDAGHFCLRQTEHMQPFFLQIMPQLQGFALHYRQQYDASENP